MKYLNEGIFDKTRRNMGLFTGNEKNGIVEAYGDMTNNMVRDHMDKFKDITEKEIKKCRDKEISDNFRIIETVYPRWNTQNNFMTKVKEYTFTYGIAAFIEINDEIKDVSKIVIKRLEDYCRIHKLKFIKIGIIPIGRDGDTGDAINEIAALVSMEDLMKDFSIELESSISKNKKENHGIFSEAQDTNIYGHIREVRPQTLINNESYNSREYGTNPNGYRYPEFSKAINEYMNLMDTNTRKTILSLNEEGQSTVLTSLTSKLYDNIINKVDDIDYGDIPMSKGDITKLDNYPKIIECIQLMRDLLKEYKQDTAPIEEIALAVSNVESRKDLFGRGYRYNSELVMVTYCNTVLSIIASISYMIASAVEFIKTPKEESFKIALDKVGYNKSKDYVLYDCLKKFNNACKDKSLDKALEGILQSKVKNLSGLAAGVGASMVVIGGVILVIIPIIKEMIFLFYYTRMRVSEFFDIQADLLQLNAYNIQSSEAKLSEDKEQIVSKQMKIVEMFRKASNFFTIQTKKAEMETDREFKENDKKYKIDEVIDEIPGGSSSLF